MLALWAKGGESLSKPRRLIWLGGLALVVGWPPGGSQASPQCTGVYAPGVVLISYKDGFAAAERSLEPEALTTIPGIGVASLSVPAGQECTARELLRSDPRVEFAELDYAVRATQLVTPNDPGWAQQWGPAQIEAPRAWSVATGTSDVVIAVLDSGLRLDHEDLAGNLWVNPGEIADNGIDDDGNGKLDDYWGWHFYHAWVWHGDKYTYLPREDEVVADDYGHGTHVAGIAGAEINNGLGIAGMAGGSRLMVVKVLDQYGSGWYSDIARGIVYAVQNGARVINLSLGGEPASETLQAAADYAHAHGVLVVASTGNDGGAVLYPAACDHVLAVSATDQSDLRAGFSNHGPQVDLAAPGVDIYSTWPWAGGYATRSGASMAVPHVSGLGALLWTARPDLSMAQVAEVITTTAADVNGGALPGWDQYLGWGRIDAGQALSAVTQSGDLLLTSAQRQLAAAETAVITASVPLTSGLQVTFTAVRGFVSPVVAAPSAGVATTTLTAGPLVGTAVVTGTTGALSGSLFLRLFPGPVVSATLTSAFSVVSPGSSVVVTLTAVDAHANPPLDGTPVRWAAIAGFVAPSMSPFFEGVARATFTAGPMPGPAVITASLGMEFSTAIAIDVSSHYRYWYLPLIWRGGAG